MKKTTGNMYENVKTWNPIDGICPHSCSYCAVKKLFNRKLPGAINKYSGDLRINEKEFKRNLGSGNTWFIAGVGNDLFAEGVKFAWIDRIIEHCQNYPNNTYMLQSKNTCNMQEWVGKTKLKITDNFIFGTTIETDISIFIQEYSNGRNQSLWRSGCLAPINVRKYVTIEPIMQFTLQGMINLISNIKPEIIYIGANSYNKIILPEPSKEEILQLISELEKICPVKQKSNLKRLLK